RGSTVALTDASGVITDTFEYDTYGKVASRTGTTTTPFLYNGRDGVMTESNGLYYMRARYYSPDLRRFINADIIPGELSNAVTLNRYAYANANPAMFIDPLGLSADGENSVEYLELLNHTLKYIIEPNSGNFINLYDCLIESFWSDADIERLTGITKEEHYNRNSYNITFPEYYDPEFFEGWNDEVGASCHQFTSPNKTNYKLVSPDGVYEVIYDKNGRRVDDPRDVGTYNYSPSTVEENEHFKKDVLPWIFWGNSPDDSTTMFERAWAYYVGGAVESAAKWIDTKADKVSEWWKGLWD
ncbi:MAG: RHS repeat-associated core domain-containing protein, partial [Clostridia bacterium]|nr:RHS repeat-associated core domain-containing protein [Clostridia bacterium]